MFNHQQLKRKATIQGKMNIGASLMNEVLKGRVEKNDAIGFLQQAGYSDEQTMELLQKLESDIESKKQRNDWLF